MQDALQSLLIPKLCQRVSSLAFSRILPSGIFDVHICLDCRVKWVEISSFLFCVFLCRKSTGGIIFLCWAAGYLCRYLYILNTLLLRSRVFLLDKSCSTREAHIFPFGIARANSMSRRSHLPNSDYVDISILCYPLPSARILSHQVDL